MKRHRYSCAALLLLFHSGWASASTLPLPVLPPDVYVTQIQVSYSVAAPGRGLLLAQGKLSKLYATDLTKSTAIMGSFMLKTYFDTTTGNDIASGADPLYHPLLELKDSSNTDLFYSTQIDEFAFNMNKTSPATFDFLWRKDGGTLAMGSNLPFIGVYLRTNTSLTSSMTNFKTSAPMGTMVFQNKQTLGLWGGDADVFMTPTPMSSTAGTVLLGIIAATSLIARRHSAPKQG